MLRAVDYQPRAAKHLRDFGLHVPQRAQELFPWLAAFGNVDAPRSVDAKDILRLVWEELTGAELKREGCALSEKEIEASDLGESEELVVSVRDLLIGEDNEVDIARAPADSEGRLYYTMHLRYFPPAEEVEAANYGVGVSREYLPVDGGEGKIESAALGDMVKVRLTLVAPTDLHYVVVEDHLPAGLEPIDTSLKTTSSEIRQMMLDEQRESASERQGRGYGWWPYHRSFFNHVDMRDNRVVLFATYLPRGLHEYVYFLRATTAGQYRVMPAQAYEMYFPEVWGRTDGALFSVRPEVADTSAGGQ